MKLEGISSILMTAFGLGEANRAAEMQRESMELVREAAAEIQTEHAVVIETVTKATDEAAEFE